MFPKSSSVGGSGIRINLAKGNIAVDAVLEAPKSPMWAILGGFERSADKIFNLEKGVL